MSLRVAGGEVGCPGGAKRRRENNHHRDDHWGCCLARAGAVSFQGDPITRLPAYQRALLGIGYAPEDAGIFPDLSVAENFRICEWLTRPKTGNDGRPAAAMPRSGFLPSFRRSRRSCTDAVCTCPAARRRWLRSRVPWHSRRPILLLDEPFEGLAPVVVTRFIDAVNKIKAMGISLLIAESNLMTAIRIADRLYAIDRGEIIFEGSPKAVRSRMTR